MDNIFSIKIINYYNMGNCANPCAGGSQVGQPVAKFDPMHLQVMVQEKERLMSMTDEQKRQYINNEMMNR